LQILESSDVLYEARPEGFIKFLVVLVFAEVEDVIDIL